jgi:transposase, IS30 family
MSYSHLRQSDRDEISILLKKGYSHREIAKAIGKDHSSISREVRKHKTKGAYDPRMANCKARLARRMSKYQGMKIHENLELANYTEDRMVIDGWTPEQVAGKLKSDNGGEPVISAKSIYKYLYSSHGQYLCKYLTHRRYAPKKQIGSGKQKKSIIPNRKSIEERPTVVSERTRFGDMEGDTLGRIKTDKEVVVGARERLSRKLFICKMPRLKYTVDGFKQMLNPHHKIIETLTLDNGVENPRYEELDIPTYFCHPYSSWEKGGIENDFKRLRRWIPKKASLANYTDEQISAIMEKMNNTPRKCLNWKTPNEMWNELYALKTNLTGVALEGKI